MWLTRERTNDRQEFQRHEKMARRFLKSILAIWRSRTVIYCELAVQIIFMILDFLHKLFRISPSTMNRSIFPYRANSLLLLLLGSFCSHLTVQSFSVISPRITFTNSRSTTHLPSTTAATNDAATATSASDTMELLTRDRYVATNRKYGVIIDIPNPFFVTYQFVFFLSHIKYTSSFRHRHMEYLFACCFICVLLRIHRTFRQQCQIRETMGR